MYKCPGGQSSGHNKIHEELYLNGEYESVKLKYRDIMLWMRNRVQLKECLSSDCWQVQAIQS